MRTVLFSILLIFSFSLADELIIGKKGKVSFYTQESEFLVAKGDSVVGPIDLLPMAQTDYLVIENENPDYRVLTYLIEPTFKDWKKNLLGKTVSYEGNGRIIKGVVRDISEKFITVETKRGVIVTTLPEFPSKISSHFNWKELYSPKITLRINSKISDSVKIYFKYPLANIYWEPFYILKVKGKTGKFYSFYNIKNQTQIYFNNIDIKIQKSKSKIFILAKKTSLPSLSEKRVEMNKPKSVNFNDRAYVGKEFPDGKVIIYKNKMIIGYGKVINGYLKLRK